jgi:hypothetical protein
MKQQLFARFYVKWAKMTQRVKAYRLRAVCKYE